MHGTYLCATLAIVGAQFGYTNLINLSLSLQAFEVVWLYNKALLCFNFQKHGSQ